MLLIPPRMKHGEDDQPVAAHAKVDAERESMHAYPANPGDDFSKPTRRRLCEENCAIDFRLEVTAQPRSLLLVPTACRDVLEKRLPPEFYGPNHFPPVGGVIRLTRSQDTTSSGAALSSSRRACSSER